MSDSDTSNDLDVQTDSPSISWPINRPASSEPWVPPKPSAPQSHTPAHTLDPSNLPYGKKSLSSISSRSFALGIALGATTVAALQLIYLSSPLWRPLFFFAALSLFHFLEFYLTARYNPIYANISAFLLTTNGSAYNIAHTFAFAECLVTYFFHPGPWSVTVDKAFGPAVQVSLGLVMMVVGQLARSLAMIEAGTNFNHVVQSRKKEGHQLVTSGVYGWLRHPAYFGFFWWGLGTQVVLGNVFCFFAYLLVMWKFFSARIRRKLSPSSLRLTARFDFE